MKNLRRLELKNANDKYYRKCNYNFSKCKVYFMPAVFLHFQTAFVFKFVAVCVLFVTALGLPPAPYMGFGVSGAGRWHLWLQSAFSSSSGGRISIWLSIIIFNFQFFIELQFRAGHYKIPHRTPSVR